MSRAVLRRIEHDLGELVERHERSRDLSEFGRYSRRPVAFIRDVLHGEPWTRQAEIAKAVRDRPLVVVRSCNGAGKDWLAAHLALWWVYSKRGLVLVTGPTERQVREVVMHEVARAFARARDLPGELFTMALRLGREEQAGILAFTSTEASRLTGFHDPRILVLLTEAQGCEPFAYEGLLSCATGAEDRVLAVGNPLAPSGKFYTICRPASGWHAEQVSAGEHPNVRQDRTVIPGGPSREFVRRIAQEFGESSGVYKARVLGEFPDEAEEGLIRRSWIDAAVSRWREGSTGSSTPVVAIDPARFGPDATVCAVRRGRRVEQLEAWRGTDLMSSVERAEAVLTSAGIERAADAIPRGVPVRWGGSARVRTPSGRVLVDEVGLGAGLLDRLAERGYPASGYNGGSSAREPERFMNRRAESWWNVRRLLEEGRMDLPPDEDLADELLAVRWSPTLDGRVRIEAKDELKGRLGRSPDKADSVVMAFDGDSRGPVSATWGSRPVNNPYPIASVRRR